ncbi:MAG: hypothetical protein ABIJ97_02770, partial [Bacteroidota bacterium]
MKYFVKIIKILFKSFGYLILAIIRLVLVMYLLLQNNTVQNYITDYFADIFSEKLKTEISIGSVDIEFFNKIVLEDFYIADQNDDTLAYINKFKIAIGNIQFREKQLKINRIILDNSYINLSADSAGYFNYKFIIDYFSSDTVPDTSTVAWNISCTDFAIFNSRLQYKTKLNAVKKDPGIVDFKNLQLIDLNLNIHNSVFGTDSIIFEISNLDFIEHSGFQVKKLFAKCLIDSQQIRLNNLLINTNNSEIKTPVFKLTFNDLKTDFADFLNNVRLETTLDSSTIYLSDLQYFSPVLKGLNRKVCLSGKFSGRIARIKGKEIELFYGNDTKFFGGISMDGLPDFDNTFIHADIDEFNTSIADLESFPLPPFDENKLLQLPYQLDQLGKITYKGKLTGFFNDFVTYGNFQTAIGYLSTDLSLKQDTTKKLLVFSGDISTIDFYPGKLIGNSDLIGKLSFNAKINGNTSTQTGRIEVLLDGKIIQVDLLGYNYSDIIINGNLLNKKFDGQLIINDPNIQMDFLGGIDFNEKIPVFDFTADVGNLNPYELKIDTLDSLLNAKFLVT